MHSFLRIAILTCFSIAVLGMASPFASWKRQTDISKWETPISANVFLTTDDLHKDGKCGLPNDNNSYFQSLPAISLAGEVVDPYTPDGDFHANPFCGRVVWLENSSGQGAQAIVASSKSMC